MDDKLAEGLKAAEMTLSEYNEFTDELITDEEISLLQKHKIPRPPNVGTSRWEQPKEFNPRHKKIIHLAAMGKPLRVIAEEVGMHPNRVSVFLNSPLVKQKVAKKQDAIFESGAKMYMKTLMNKAYATIETILEDHDEKSSVKLEAAKFVIDHVVGKATQVVEQKTSLLAEFIVRLDSQRDQERVVHQIKSTPEEPEYVAVEVPKEEAEKEAATAMKFLEKEHDAMDTLVDSIIGTDFVVGRRDKNGSQS